MRRYTCIGEPKLFPPLFVSFFSLAYNDVKKNQQLYFPLDCIVCHLYLSSIYECDEWVSPFFNSCLNFKVFHNNTLGVA